MRKEDADNYGILYRSHNESFLEMPFSSKTMLSSGEDDLVISGKTNKQKESPIIYYFDGDKDVSVTPENE